MNTHVDAEEIGVALATLLDLLTLLLEVQRRVAELETKLNNLIAAQITEA